MGLLEVATRRSPSPGGLRGPRRPRARPAMCFPAGCADPGVRCGGWPGLSRFGAPSSCSRFAALPEE
eukprot:12665062-Alexandrium_andersonii.AAC.1